MAENTDTATRRRPSPGLLLAGLAALLVSLWAFVGPIDIGTVTGGNAKWLLIAAAVVVGVVLVAAPARRK